MEEADQQAARRRELMNKINSLPPEQQAAYRELLRKRLAAKPFYCTTEGCDGSPHKGFPYQHARSDQHPPEGVPGTDWRTWVLAGGRGSGKTRSGAEYMLKLSKTMRRIAIIAPTASDLRDTIVEGPSGLVNVCEAGGAPGHYEPSKARFTFDSGCVALLISSEEPSRLRGKQFEALWMDEPAHYKNVDDVWDQAMFCLRLGNQPHVLLTTTPLPTKWMKARMEDPRSRVVRVSTYANKANLAEDFLREIKDKYEGTRLGRQEIYGEILDDVEGALWNGDMFLRAPVPDDLERVVVGVDPAGSTGKRSDETGIMVLGKKGRDTYVLEDATGKYTPERWARKVAEVFRKWDANTVVVERNFGGDMVKANIRAYDDTIPVKEVRASRGKQVRAEPLVSHYEQGRVYHCSDYDMSKLEQEQVSWVPSDPRSPSPNRIDAEVWAWTDLFNAPGPAKFISAVGRRL